MTSNLTVPETIPETVLDNIPQTLNDSSNNTINNIPNNTINKIINNHLEKESKVDSFIGRDESKSLEQVQIEIDNKSVSSDKEPDTLKFKRFSKLGQSRRVAETEMSDSSNKSLFQFMSKSPEGKYEKLNYRNVYNIIQSYYTYKENNWSTALDILVVYLKGQKILYTESKTFCEQKLNILMLPAIFISSVCSVLSLFPNNEIWGGIVVSTLNAFNAFLLALISYLKLDAKAEAHKVSAYKYDKLQSLCEFNSGKLLFCENPQKEFDEIINEIETNVKEIKETNQFILPEHIRYKYKTLYSTNVFAEVKKVQNDEMIKINELKNKINQSINYLNMTQTQEIKEILMELEKEQNEIISNIIKHKQKFSNLDKLFQEEIDDAILHSQKKCCRCSCLKT